MKEESLESSAEENGQTCAFPMKFDDGGYNLGMSLREWFAGQALAGLVNRWMDTYDAAVIAREAVAVADRLLLELAKD